MGFFFLCFWGVFLIDSTVESRRQKFNGSIKLGEKKEFSGRRLGEIIQN